MKIKRFKDIIKEDAATTAVAGSGTAVDGGATSSFTTANGIAVSGGSTGTSFSTGSNTQGMGDVISSQPSDTPGDVAGSSKGSGDIGVNLGTYTKKPPKTKKKKKDKKVNDSINAVENTYIRSFSDMYTEMNTFNELKKFLSQFPNDADNWKEATDEIREIAKLAKEYYNEYDLELDNNDVDALKPLDFNKLNTPSKWNTKGKEYIIDIYDKMSAKTKKEFIKNISFKVNENKNIKYSYVGVKDNDVIQIYIVPIDKKDAYNIGYIDDDSKFVLYNEDKFIKENINDIKTLDITNKQKANIEESITEKDKQNIEKYIK